MSEITYNRGMDDAYEGRTDEKKMMSDRDYFEGHSFVDSVRAKEEYEAALAKEQSKDPGMTEYKCEWCGGKYLGYDMHSTKECRYCADERLERERVMREVSRYH